MLIETTQLSEAWNTLITYKSLFPYVYKLMLMETPLLGYTLTTIVTTKWVPPPPPQTPQTSW